MSETGAIERAEAPATVSSLLGQLRVLGVEPGVTLMVHSSLSALGYVTGGAHAVVLALLEAVGTTGTLVMPTHSTDLTDPGVWSNPPVPEAWWPSIREEMPAFDPVLTPTRHMGAIVECFRHVTGVVRSTLPTVSAAAVGPNARFITEGHALAMGLGELSPQARVYELDGSVLLLGVSHANNTALHLAERRSAPADAAVNSESSPVLIDGERRWVTYDSLDDDPSDFTEIGEAFAAIGRERVGPVGAGVARLMRSRDLVDFATDWMNEHRTWRRGTGP
jgi:aminoglycoside 3-N-acetyltransferase